MSTITAMQQASIADYFRGRTIPVGLGNKEHACSIGGINLALTGKLTGKVPTCMSRVTGKWIIGVQDAMPHAMRNSDAWRNLLPLAAGTGRDPATEKARLAIIMDWMWGSVLPVLQPVANNGGFSDEWLRMTTERSASSARAAYTAAYTAYISAPYTAAADDAAVAAAHAVDAAAHAAAHPAAYISAAVDAAYAAAYASAAAIGHVWEAYDPCRLLKQLIEA